MKLLTSLGKARLLTILVGIGSFFLFRATLHEGFFPGESARQASIAMQLEPGLVSLETTQIAKRTISPIGSGSRASVGTKSVTTDIIRFHTKQIFWRLASSLVAALPIGQIPVSERLNGFCALLGALCAALAFALGRGLTLFLSFHSTTLSAKNRKRAATCAGLAGAILLSTAMPFWIASTRCSPYPFEILLLLGMGYALFRASVGHRTFPLLVFGVLFGISIFEWQVGLFLAPIFLFFAFRAMLVGEVNDAYGVTNVLVGIAIGLLAYLLACHFFLAREGVPFLLAFREILFSLKYGAGLLFRGGTFESNPLLVSFCFAVLPFLAMTAMAIWRGVDSATSSSGLLLFALSCTFTVCALDLPITPWGATRTLAAHPLPVTSYLLNAAIGAYLAGQAALMAGGHFLARPKTRQHDDFLDDDAPGDEHRDSPVGRILLWYVMVFTLCIAGWNAMKMRDWNDSFLDRVAIGAASDLGERAWILTGNDSLDSLLRIHARLQGKRIAVVNPASERALPLFRNAIDRKAETFRHLPPDDLAKLRDALATTNATAFITKWIFLDEEIGSKLIVMEADEIIHAGKIAVPAFIGFHAAPKDSETDWDELADRHLAFWATLSALPPLGADAPLWLRTDRAAARHQLAVVGRYLADKLAKDSHLDKAQKLLSAIDVLSEEPIATRGPADYHPLY